MYVLETTYRAAGRIKESIYLNFHFQDASTTFWMRSLEEGSRPILQCLLSGQKEIIFGGKYLDGMGQIKREEVWR